MEGAGSWIRGKLREALAFAAEGTVWPRSIGAILGLRAAIVT